jgi:peptide/nickel transport system permease protein
MADTDIGRSVATESSTQQKVGSFFKTLFRHHPLGAFGLVIMAAFFVMAIFAEQIAPYEINDTDINRRLQAPSAEHLLGTDLIGRDMLSRIIVGTRTSLTIGMAASAISVAIAVLLGILSGYLGGVVDMFTQRFVDAWMAIPGLIILMVMISIVGTSVFAMILILSLGGIVTSRLIRSTVIRIKEDVYLAAAAAVGASTPRLLLRHVLPNILAPIIVAFTSSVPGYILAESTLSFLGFGIGPPTPSWGGMLGGGGGGGGHGNFGARALMFEAPHLAIWPGVALALVVYGANMFGDALRDILDPRLRGGAGRFSSKQAQKRVLKLEGAGPNGGSRKAPSATDISSPSEISESLEPRGGGG